MQVRTMIAAFALACAGQMASAATVSVFSGTATELTGVTNAADDALKSDTIQYFVEKEAYTLPVKQVVNIEVGYPVLKGTEVNVFMVFLNSVTTAANSAFAGLEFDGDILGVVYGTDALNMGNHRYGGAGYDPLNGIETGLKDSVSVAGNRLLVNLNNTNGTGDWVRVLTSTSLSNGFDAGAQPFDDSDAQTTPVPVPASGLLIGFGMAGFAAMRRIKSKR